LEQYNILYVVTAPETSSAVW